MTEKEKMLAGETYSAVDPQLLEELTEVKEIFTTIICLVRRRFRREKKYLEDYWGILLMMNS